MIELKNLTKTFYTKNTAVDALSGVSLRVAEGEIFGVIGASGAGKSTLIRCINLLERPTQGEVIVDRQRLLDLKPRQLTLVRRHIGMIFQHFNLLSSRTVYENVALPLELSHTPAQEIAARVNELLALVGLQGRESDYPARLSGGQKQRVAIARTLASNPKVLLCDEATSALDPETTQSILSLLKDINRRFKITILLITHEMNVVKTICDRVAVISAGKLIEQGTVSEIFSHPRQELTRRFIASSLHFVVPPEYAARLHSQTDLADVKHPLVKLEFSGASADLPQLSAVSRKFEIDIQIVTAQLEQAGGIQFGFMLVELSGTAENTQQAIDYYIAHQVKAEIIGYV